MFKNIKIKNLRAISDLEIENLGQVNLLVGQNNCGKTTVLEALFLLIGATNPALPLTANSLRGLSYFTREMWQSFFHNYDDSYPITIKGGFQDYKMECQDDKMLTIRCRKTTQVINSLSSSDIEEVSKTIKNGTSQPNLVINGLDLEYISSRKPSEKIKTAISEQENRIIPEGVKPSYVEGFFMGSYSQGTELKARFDSIQNNEQLLDEVISLLKHIDPNISDLRLNRTGILIANIGISNLVPVNLLGGGMMKFLDVAFAMLNYRNGIVLIDEIENGLHHSVQEKLWDAIFTWSKRLNIQVFATTHSDECIRAFSDSVDMTLFGSEAKLFRIERKDEKIRAVEYTQKQLNESLESKWEVR